MSENNEKFIEGISIRRQKRWKSKKRKIQAFLNIVAEEESESKMPKVENSVADVAETIEQSLQRLRKLTKSYEEKKCPAFYLTEHGFNAQINFTFYNKEKPLGQTVAPLFVEDVQQLLLKAVLGDSHECNLRWGKFEKVTRISHVVLFVIDGISKDEIIENINLYEDTLKIFSAMVEVLTPASYSLNFATELCGLHLTLGFRSTLGEKKEGIGLCTSYMPLETVFPSPMREHCVVMDSGDVDDSFSKLHLLLSPIQLVMENFPLPKDILPNSKSDGYCYTKLIYSHATSNSPMFALDCEMCRMKSGRMEVTRIAVIDEKFNIIYNTLVKPQGPVSDYLTKYSGVDKKMLGPVKTTLKDVQKHLQSILPPDAILCGQSLNFDLHALKMIHPYVIDTSVIYNTSGCRTKKCSLRILSEIFLQEVIQDSRKGHDPIEDCIAAMKLVQLKLKNGPAFGDVIVAEHNKSKKVEAAKLSLPKNNIYKVVNTEPTVTVNNTNNSNLSTRFFSKLRNEGKNICIVSDSISYVQYPCSMLTDSIDRVVKGNMKKIVKHSMKRMPENNLTICHINSVVNPGMDSVHVDINKYIKKLFDACASKSLFITVATGSKKEDTYQNGLCMIRIKNES